MKNQTTQWTTEKVQGLGRRTQHGFVLLAAVLASLTTSPASADQPSANQCPVSKDLAKPEPLLVLFSATLDQLKPIGTNTLTTGCGSGDDKQKFLCSFEQRLSASFHDTDDVACAVFNDQPSPKYGSSKSKSISQCGSILNEKQLKERIQEFYGKKLNATSNAPEIAGELSEILKLTCSAHRAMYINLDYKKESSKLAVSYIYRHRLNVDGGNWVPFNAELGVTEMNGLVVGDTFPSARIKDKNQFSNPTNIKFCRKFPFAVGPHTDAPQKIKLCDESASATLTEEDVNDGFKEGIYHIEKDDETFFRRALNADFAVSAGSTVTIPRGQIRKLRVGLMVAGLGLLAVGSTVFGLGLNGRLGDSCWTASSQMPTYACLGRAEQLQQRDWLWPVGASATAAGALMVGFSFSHLVK